MSLLGLSSFEVEFVVGLIVMGCLLSGIVVWASRYWDWPER